MRSPRAATDLSALVPTVLGRLRVARRISVVGDVPSRTLACAPTGGSSLSEYHSLDALAHCVRDHVLGCRQHHVKGHVVPDIVGAVSDEQLLETSTNRLLTTNDLARDDRTFDPAWRHVRNGFLGGLRFSRVAGVIVHSASFRKEKRIPCGMAFEID
jgi:hypothetical protein